MDFFAFFIDTNFSDKQKTKMSEAKLRIKVEKSRKKKRKKKNWRSLFKALDDAVKGVLRRGPQMAFLVARTDKLFDEIPSDVG